MGGSVTDGDNLPSRIAALVHTHFDGLPKRSKPIIRDDGTAEWIPMTGIVLVKGQNTHQETLTCVAVTSGAKCLPASQISSCNGLVLHDCHAEILAMRAFNFWLLSECRAVLANEPENSSPEGRAKNGPQGGPASPSPYIRCCQKPESETAATTPPFELLPDVNIYMYCTCAPCGDASMELVMAAQDDPTPWDVPSTSTATEPEPTPSTQPPGQFQDQDPGKQETTLLGGRAYFSKLGIVRRKPARADAESTKSKSCSDKLALRQVTSLLNHETSLLVAVTPNVYIKGLIMPEEEISRVGAERCFGGSGRMEGLKGRVWPVSGGRSESGPESEPAYRYEYRPFEILSIPNNQLKSLWPYRKSKASDAAKDPDSDSQVKKSKPGTISAMWVRAPTEHHHQHKDGDPSLSSPLVYENGTKNLPVLRGSKTGLFESIINGVRQGNKASAPGLRGASALSRARMWEYLKRIDAGSNMCGSAVGMRTYREFKEQPQIDGIQARQDAMRATKDVLGGWVPNSGDEKWGWNHEGLVDLKGVYIGEAPKKRKR